MKIEAAQRLTAGTPGLGAKSSLNQLLNQVFKSKKVLKRGSGELEFRVGQEVAPDVFKCPSAVSLESLVNTIGNPSETQEADGYFFRYWQTEFGRVCYCNSRYGGTGYLSLNKPIDVKELP